MALGRIVRNGRIFDFVELDIAEVGRAIDEAIDINLPIWQVVVRKVKKFADGQQPKLAGNEVDSLCDRIFKACCVRSYPILITELDRKVHVAKNEEG
jgi:hypothetical protein